MADTVRARLLLQDPAPPEAISHARKTLTALGFQVAAEDPAGIAFEGDRERFEQVFGSPAATPLAVPDELAGVATGVVLPRSPELFP
ncbi:MAG TPA: hypothetical protein VFX51_03765 [Solirubrobacteraceae bacterium]|nr:hypothetical protein [Solirubrobacteraceae bacterium]